jgi:hypothetical protein
MVTTHPPGTRATDLASPARRPFSEPRSGNLSMPGSCPQFKRRVVMFTHDSPRQHFKIAQSQRPGHNHARQGLSWRGQLRRF